MAEGVWYNESKRALFNGEIDLGHDTLKLAIVTGYTPDIDADDGWDDISANEVTNVSGYTAGGETLTGVVVTEDQANNRGLLDSDDVPWTGLEVVEAPSHVVLMDTTDSTNILIAYWPATTLTNGGNWTVQWHATDKVLTLT